MPRSKNLGVHGRRYDRKFVVVHYPHFEQLPDIGNMASRSAGHSMLLARFLKKQSIRSPVSAYFMQVSAISRL